MVKVQVNITLDHEVRERIKETYPFQISEMTERLWQLLLNCKGNMKQVEYEIQFIAAQKIEEENMTDVCARGLLSEYKMFKQMVPLLTATEYLEAKKANTLKSLIILPKPKHEDTKL